MVKKYSQIIFGIGLGFFLAGMILTLSNYQSLDKVEIEKLARDQGMIYPGEIKVDKLFN
ncbi:hypothetical protein SAMN00017405_0908 [Desulfonispora thiosulfatigenes DSM 11270]|uniref:Uncharacterized protein n=1 Tax=Desulfonispora thiosulfatigenes DSM 11270 TaxID=656914 RepID=A0A1W1UMG9_DESTI|nr:hypothetical protein [Desulfonispora thiosulfatigenes]SMB82277.1 hypothetical protein SAMN00017405_0908 [Desulfonispora thiosulfatigenes DSM 11270]